MMITAAGSLPGDDFRGALSAMAEALPELMPLPELPARGVESQMIGRALGLIDDLHFDLQPSGWRLTNHSDAAHRKARALWRRDLDDAEELLQAFDGVLKVAITGPWTLASTVERPRGDRLLADHGARRDVAQALLEGAQRLASELRRRLPDVDVRWQIDEPALVAVRDGRVPTASGFSKHRSVEVPQLAEALKPFHDAILHCCAPGKWLDVASSAGFTTIYGDAALVGIDALGQWVDAGNAVVLGIVDAARRTRQPVDELVRAAKRVTRELGVGDWLTLAPSCGLAGWNPSDVMWQLSELRRAGELLDQDRA